MLRVAETQKPSGASDSDRVVTTTRFDSRGQTIQNLGPYTVTGSIPSGVFYSPAPEQVLNNHRYVFDGAGRQTADIYQPKNDEAAGGWRTTTSYDADRTMVDPPDGGTPTTEIVDVRGRTTQLVEHLGRTTAATSTRTTDYSYDPAGNMLSMTDPKDNVWKWTYDLRGNQVTAKDPDKGSASMTYDNNDQLLTTTDNRGISTRVVYDELGRKVGLYDGLSIDPAKLRASWVYDTLAAGQLTSSTRYATPGDPSTAYVSEVTGYNEQDQPTGTRTTVPSIAGQTDTLAGTYTTAMTYNDDGTLKTKTLPTAYGLPTETITMSYDRLGQPISMGGRDSVVGATTYSPYGELLQVTTGTTSGKLAYQTWYYNEGTRRLTRNIVSNQAISGSLLDTTYGYDNAGNVIRAADTTGTKDIQCFDYDYLRQLKQAWTIASGACSTPSQSVMSTSAGAYWSTYNYDAAGNRTKEVEHVKTGTDNTTYTYTYPASGAAAYPNGSTGVGGPHAVSSVTKQVGTGTATTTNYKYDATGNMTTRGNQTLTWDSEGELSSTKTGTANAATNVYDADGNRILRRDPNGTATLYLDSTEIKLSGTTKTSQRWYTFGGKVVATRTSAGLQMLAADHHDTGQVQIDAASAAYVKRRFDPFGSQRTGAGTATWSGDHGFLNKPVDASGLTQIGARYYDASIGRFISVDPMLVTDDPRQANAYSYAGNNPMTTSDPTGEMLPAPEGGGSSSTGSSGHSTSSPPSTPTTPYVPSPSSAPSPPASDPVVAKVVSSYGQARSLMKEIMSTVWMPVSVSLGFAGAGHRSFDMRSPRHSRGSWLNPFNRRSDRSMSAWRLRTGNYELPGEHAAPRMWQKVNWDKVGKVFDSKWVKGAGIAGTAIGTVYSFSEHKEAGDTNTEAALKAGIEVGFATGGAVLGGAIGGACGPAAPACSTVLGGAGAWAGGQVGGLVTDTSDSQIGWTAGKIDDGIDFVQDVDFTPWN